MKNINTEHRVVEIEIEKEKKFIKENVLIENPLDALIELERNIEQLEKDQYNDADDSDSPIYPAGMGVFSCFYIRIYWEDAMGWNVLHTSEAWEKLNPLYIIIHDLMEYYDDYYLDIENYYGDVDIEEDKDGKKINVVKCRRDALLKWRKTQTDKDIIILDLLKEMLSFWKDIKEANWEITNEDFLKALEKHTFKGFDA